MLHFVMDWSMVFMVLLLRINVYTIDKGTIINELSVTIRPVNCSIIWVCSCHSCIIILFQLCCLFSSSFHSLGLVVCCLFLLLSSFHFLFLLNRILIFKSQMLLFFMMLSVIWLGKLVLMMLLQMVIPLGMTFVVVMDLSKSFR